MSKSNKEMPVAIFSRTNQQDEKQADMYVLGSIPDMDEETWTIINTDKEFINEFKDLESNYDRINIWINSPGGRVTDGMAMINTIRNSTKDVHTYNLGLAASMGAVLLLSGKTVHAPADSIIMLHTASGRVEGNKTEVREYADMLEVFETAIISMVATRSGQSAADIGKKYFDGKDHFMTGQTAFDDGLIDDLATYELDLPVNAASMSFTELANHFSTDKSTIMSLKDFFNKPSNTDGNEIVNISAAELNTLKADSVEALATIENLSTENVTLTATVATITGEKEAAEASLQQAITDHTTATTAAVEALALVKAEFEAFKAASGDDHSNAGHTDDGNLGEPPAGPVSQIRKDEAAAKALGEKIHAKNQTKTTI